MRGWIIIIAVSMCNSAVAQMDIKGIVAAPYNPALRVGGKTIGQWTTLECTIERYQGVWAWIHTEDGKEGWVQASEVVPLNGAIDYFTQKIRAEPHDAAWRQIRAIVWQRQGETDLAIADLTEAIAMRPGDVYHYYNTRGNLYSDKGDYTRALADYNQAIRLKPDDAFAWNNAGMVRRYLGEFDKAIANVSRAIQLSPYAGAYDNRARAWAGKGDFDRAIVDYGEAIRLDPKAVYAYLGRASAWEAKGENAKALADYDRALRLAPNDAEAHNGRAWLLATSPDEKVRDGRTAVAAATKACELTQWKDGSYIDTLAAAYAETGDFEMARTYERQCLSLVPATMIANCEARLALYQENKPFRMPPRK